MKDRLRFEARDTIDDGYGAPVSGPWVSQFIRPAEVRPLRGGEVVTGARLQGQQPVQIIIRFDTAAALITNDWQAVDTRTGEVYTIKNVVDAERRREFLTIDAVLGERSA